MTMGEPVHTTPAASPHGQDFLGRDRELRDLRAACDRAAAGSGAVVFVAGEPGIGKTALCDQLTMYAIRTDMAVFVGHCFDIGPVGVPYQPIVEALRDYVRGAPIEDLSSATGEAASDIADVFPELQRRLGADRQTSKTAHEDRWRVLNGLCDFLRLIATRQPFVLILEDLHWADQATLDLLVVLSRRVPSMPVLVVCTYRDIDVDRTHPLSSVLAELRRGAAFR